MIKIKSIEGKNGSKKPEYLPKEKTFGQHSDDDFFYFFETQAEYDEHNKLVQKNTISEEKEIIDYNN